MSRKRIVELLIPVEPIPWSRPGKGKKGHSYTPTKQRKFMVLIAGEARKCFTFNPIKEAIELEMEFCVKRPKTVKRTYPSVKPDITNYAKIVEDALNGIWYKDDCQIVTETLKKRYHHTPYVRVIMYWV